MQTKEPAVVEVDKEKGIVYIKSKETRVSPKMFKLLCALIDAKGGVLTRDQLMEKVWGVDKTMEIDTRTVDQHVARLRMLIGKGGLGRACLISVTGQGYRGKNIEYVGKAAEQPAYCAGCQREIKAAKKALAAKGIKL